MDSPWAGSQFGVLIGIPFPQAFNPFVPAVLSDWKSSESEFLSVGWQPHPSSCYTFFPLGSWINNLLHLTEGISNNVHHLTPENGTKKD